MHPCMLRRLQGCISFLRKIELLHNKYDLIKNNVNKMCKCSLFWNGFCDMLNTTSVGWNCTPDKNKRV